ncbi:hypothetical protein [Gloeobacter violaceus]|nr:hypothetical protein [Gloeobacter violaceus]
MHAQAGGYLVIVEGNRKEEIQRADLVLHGGGIENYDVYAVPDDSQSRP